MKSKVRQAWARIPEPLFMSRLTVEGHSTSLKLSFLTNNVRNNNAPYLEGSLQRSNKTKQERAQYMRSHYFS